VQVQLTEFVIESFPLEVEVGSQPAKASAAMEVVENGHSLPRVKKDHTRDLLERLECAGPSPFVSQLDPADGTSCLSIIGMIEPGKTIRLYRQIN